MLAGESASTSSGRAAPAENVAADVRAAWIGRAVVGDAELVPGMGAERVLRHEWVRDPEGKVVVETAGDVDSRKFLTLGRRVLSELASFPCEIGLFGIGLRTHLDVLAGRHRHLPCD